MKKANKLDVIGSKSTVSFLDIGVSDVPAKIDTGADSSSVWASDIQEKDGVLSFSLFDPQTSWYSNERLSTKNYTLRAVKNSFGDSEFRYKVYLKIKIEGKTIKARFTLSDRSNNRYPVLIGRRTLKNRFLVDVARHSVGHDKNATRSRRRVLLLASASTGRMETFFNEAQKLYSKDFLFDLRTYDDISVVIETNNLRVLIDGRKELNEYDLCYFLTRVSHAETAAIIANYAKYYNIAFADEAALHLPTDRKAHQLALLALAGIQVPKTIQLPKSKWEENYSFLKKELGLPFVFKDDSGRKGRNNFLIQNKKDFVHVLKDASENGLQMVAQEFVQSEGYYRILVLRRNVAMVVYRGVDQALSHLYIPKGKHIPEMVPESKLPTDVIKSAIHSAILLRLDVAGVDMIRDKQSGKWYCLEVNNSPQVTSGLFVEEKMEKLIQFFNEEMNR